MSEMQLPTRQLVLATAGTMMALLLASLDQTIVGTALPRIVAELNGLQFYSWVITAYLVMSTTTVPIAGKLGDLFGRKPFLLAGMVGFVLASALCGWAQNMAELVTFRGIQGLFGGILFASVFTVIADLYPPARRARVQGLFGGVFGLSSIVGPLTGGWITEHLGWRWAFYVNLPIGVIAVLLVAAALPYVRSRASWRDIDFAGAATLTAGLVPLLTALSITRDHAWTSPEVSGLLAFALLMLAAFVVIELRVAQPIVPFGLFKNNVFAISMLVGFLSSVGMFSGIVFAPLLFQGVLGVTITNSGLLLTPMMLGVIGSSVAAGQLMFRIRHYRYIGTVGAAIIMLALYLLSRVTPQTSELAVSLNLVLLGAGIGVTFPIYITAVQSALPREFLGVGTSQLQFWRNVGGTVTSAVFGSYLANRLPHAVAQEVARVAVPPGARLPRFDSSSAQTLFDPAHLAAMRAQLPPQALPVFEQMLGAVRVALAHTLSEIFLLACLISSLALIATVLLKEVPLQQARRGEAPVVEAPQAAAAAAD
jgi:EmrB/QacA subfamily drug resistance transporter